MPTFFSDVRRDGVRRRRACFLLALAMPLTPASSQSPGRHPDRRYVDQSVPVTTTVSLTGPRSAIPLALGASTVSIGVEDGPEQLMFGEITSAAVNSRGQVVVVDRRTEDVRLFDPQGKFLQRLGKKGQGPGEFRAPHTVLVTPSDEIWIVDMQRRISVFAPSPDGYKLAGTIPVEMSIRSMCQIGSVLVVNGIVLGTPNAVHILHAQTARPQLSFGRLYSSPNEVINWQFMQGKAICDVANDLVILATAAELGEVRAYRLDGRPVWRVAMDGIKTNIITDTDRGNSVAASPDGAHELLSLNLIAGVGAVVQYGFRTPVQMAADEPATNIQTVVIDPRSGAAVLSSAMLPRLGAASGNRVISFFEDPAPRLEIRELRSP